MWAAAVSLEYSFSPALADIASASSGERACGVMVALQVVGETQQAEARDPWGPEIGRPGAFERPPGARPDPPWRGRARSGRRRARCR